MHKLLELVGFEHDLVNEYYHMPDQNVYKIFSILSEI